jgi:DNA mismatch repair protein MutS2
MNNTTKRDLEIDRVLESLSTLTLSYDGIEELHNSPFICDAKIIQEKQAIIEDLSLIPLYNEISPHSFPDISIIMSHLHANPYSLQGDELFLLNEYLRSGEQLYEYLNAPKRNNSTSNDEHSSTLSSTLMEMLPPALTLLRKEIDFCLESPGIVKMSHPAISRLAKSLEQKRNQRQSYSLSFLKENKEVAVSSVPTFKDQRVVLPIRNDRRGEVDGFINSSSNSKATVFMESYPLVQYNNQVVLLQQEIEIEIAKIIASLSKMALEAVDEIELLRKKVGYVDALIARARYKTTYQCTYPIINDDSSIHLIEARHPLLKKEAVPITLIIEKPIRSVVISGPNAGGKTVSIKTVALLAYMHQTLFVVPAKEGSTLPLFSSIYSDVGDEQSIEKSLSTFSSHMQRISDILHNVDSNSLVILDELGSGTDPIEGSALARSILEYLMDNGGITLITSHHSLLKQYAYAHPHVLNASMEFDEETHNPTFKVISGLPGDSHALDTARRMGLPESVISTAQKHIGLENVAVSAIISSLEQKQREAQKLKDTLKQKERELIEHKRVADLRDLSLNQKERLVREEQIGSLSQFISDKSKELENLVATLREGEITKEKTKRVKQYIESLDTKKVEAEQKVESLYKRDKKAIKRTKDTPLSVGTHVVVGEKKKEGIIVRQEKKGKYQVAIGGVKFTFDESMLEPRDAPKRKTPIISYSSSAEDVKMSIDVRGKNLQDALLVVDTQLEGALLHGMQIFSIIHGMGDGILMRGIHQHLSKLKFVSSFYVARPEDGGHGKTYVEMVI